MGNWTPVPQHGACLNQAVERNVIIITVRKEPHGDLQTTCCFIGMRACLAEGQRRHVRWIGPWESVTNRSLGNSVIGSMFPKAQLVVGTWIRLVGRNTVERSALWRAPRLQRPGTATRM